MPANNSMRTRHQTRYHILPRLACISLIKRNGKFIRFLSCQQPYVSNKESTGSLLENCGLKRVVQVSPMSLCMLYCCLCSCKLLAQRILRAVDRASMSCLDRFQQRIDSAPLVFVTGTRVIHRLQCISLDLRKKDGPKS